MVVDELVIWELGRKCDVSWVVIAAFPKETGGHVYGMDMATALDVARVGASGQRRRG
jgi:hypothetical protein